MAHSTKIDSLLPYPGSKRKKWYRNILQPLPGMTAICSPFMGGAATPLAHHYLPAIMGESQRELRQLATLAPEDVPVVMDQYRHLVHMFQSDLEGTVITKQDCNMKQLRATYPDQMSKVSQRYRTLLDKVTYDANHTLADYLFAQRGAWGNCMRRSKQSDRLNTAWHITKLNSALCVDKVQESLNTIANLAWDRTVVDSWEDAIQMVRNPHTTYLELDPPYYSGGQFPMIAAYPQHDPTSDECLELSVGAMRMGMELGFPLIHLCNYDTPQIRGAISCLALRFGYNIRWFRNPNMKREVIWELTADWHPTYSTVPNR
jgi:site-specific DNA-adenine methylase